jgi:cytochrome c biogenesis protein ResB
VEGENDAIAIIGTAIAAIGFLVVGSWWVGALLVALFVILLRCVIPAHWL